MNAHGVALRLVGLVCFLAAPIEVAAQTLSDGPIQLRVRVREVNNNFSETDPAFFGVAYRPDELTYKLWARGSNPSAGWVGGQCLQANVPTLPGNSADLNFEFFDVTYPNATVPQFFDVRLDAFEDESSDALLGIGCGGSRCTHDVAFCCGGFLFGICLGQIDDDDLRCNANPFKTGMDYRLGGACQWYDHGQIAGSCPSNNVYLPHIESYWRYTNGSAATPIDLGTLGGAVSHTNSNVCYSDDAPAFAGNDVRYAFTVAQPLDLTASLCGAGFNTVLTLLDSSETLIGTNDDACGAASQLTTTLEPGNYFLVVDGTSAAEQGSFTLSLSPVFLPTPTPTATVTATPTITTTPTLTPTVSATPTPTGPCGSAPRSGCFEPQRISAVHLRDHANDSRDLLRWSWRSASGQFLPSDFGNPVDGPTGFDLCVFDIVGTTPRLAMSASVPAGGSCGGRPCWSRTSQSFVYTSPTGTSGGIRFIKLKAGATGGLLQVRGRGANLAMPAVDGTLLRQRPEVVVQLQRNDAAQCWEARYISPPTRNTASTFWDHVRP